MASTINTNINSLTAQRNLSMSQSSLSTSMQRLSSGLRINSAKDDAAGLAIADRFSSQIRGSTQAARNANDGISLAQTAEGALGSIGTNLQRIRELSVQSANATNSASDRAALQQEVGQLTAEIDRVATQTQFNGINLLDGKFSAQKFQVGANVGQTITVDSINSARTSALGKFNGFNNQSLGAITSGSAAAMTVTLNSTPTNTVVNLNNGDPIATDAKAISLALNASGIQGLTATAAATTVSAGAGALTASATTGNVATLTLNGTNITLAQSGNLQTNLATTTAAINAQSANTGVIATNTGSGVSLSAADGRNIVTAFAPIGTPATASAVTDFGLAASTTTTSTVSVTYQAATGTSVTGVAFAGAGLTTSTKAVAETGTAISAVDISTADGATAAITAVDAALEAVNTSRATLGAVQSRFQTTTENLQITSENLSASRSRIQDADFAAETANLSRTQILQQAGTAMVAQANQLPQGVLQLLKG
jgi:flagellin